MMRLSTMVKLCTMLRLDSLVRLCAMEKLCTMVRLCTMLKICIKQRLYQAETMDMERNKEENPTEKYTFKGVNTITNSPPLPFLFKEEHTLPRSLPKHRGMSHGLSHPFFSCLLY